MKVKEEVEEGKAAKVEEEEEEETHVDLVEEGGEAEAGEGEEG